MIRSSYILLLFLFSTATFSQEVLVINDTTKSVFLGKFCTYKNLSNTTQNSDLSKSITGDNIELSPDEKHRLIFKIKNNGTKDRKFLLFLHNAQLDSVSIKVYDNTTLINQSLTGCNMPASERPTTDRTLSLPLQLTKHKEYTVYLEVYGREFQIAITPHLVDPIDGIDFRWTDYLFMFLFLFIAVIFTISIIIVFHIRKLDLPIKDLLWLLFYHASGFLYLLATSGYGSLYVWGDFPWFEVNAAIFFGSTSCLGLIEFSRRILDLKTGYPKTNKAFYYISRFYIFCCLLGFLHFFPLLFEGFYRNLITIPYLLMTYCLCTILYICYKFYKTTKEYKYLWLLFFYLFHVLFYVLILMVENNLVITYNFKTHAIINVLCYVPQSVLSLVFLVLFIVDKIEKQNLLLKNLRSKILSECHSNVLESLTRISMSAFLLFSDDKTNDIAKQTLHKIYKEATTAENHLRDLYFSIDTEIESFEHLQIHFKELSRSYFQNTNTQVHFRSDILNRSKLVHQDVKGHLLMMYKEALNNIVKHARAQHVIITVELFENNKYKIKIQDDGVGFDVDRATVFRHGLMGLNYRAKQINGTFVIKSKINNGTKVIISGKI